LILPRKCNETFIPSQAGITGDPCRDLARCSRESGGRSCAPEARSMELRPPVLTAWTGERQLAPAHSTTLWRMGRLWNNLPAVAGRGRGCAPELPKRQRNWSGFETRCRPTAALAVTAPLRVVLVAQPWNIVLGLLSTTDTSTRALGACRAAADISDPDTAAMAKPNARMAGMMMVGRRTRMAPPY
jgi:hypothetical protein